MKYRSHRASILLETTMAVVLMTVAFVAVAQVLALAARQHRDTQWRTLATLEAANALERIMTQPWAEISRARSEVSLSAVAAERLPQAQLQIDIRPAEGVLPAKRIHVRVDWINSAGQRGRPVELVAWKHQEPG